MQEAVRKNQLSPRRDRSRQRLTKQAALKHSAPNDQRNHRSVKHRSPVCLRVGPSAGRGSVIAVLHSKRQAYPWTQATRIRIFQQKGKLAVVTHGVTSVSLVDAASELGRHPMRRIRGTLDHAKVSADVWCEAELDLAARIFNRDVDLTRRHEDGPRTTAEEPNRSRCARAVECRLAVAPKLAQSPSPVEASHGDGSEVPRWTQDGSNHPMVATR